MDTDLLHFDHLGKIAIFQNFWNLTYQLKTQFTQLQNDQNAKFKCPSDAEFPEFSQNGLTFDPSPFILGVMVKKPFHNFFLGHTVNIRDMWLG